MIHQIHVIDSHTEGEPTRVVVDGGPDLGAGDAAQRRERFSRDFDSWRRALVTEPRASDAWVGALLGAPVDPAAAAQVIYFNNTGYINMCVHGSIGVAQTLAYLGRIGVGVHRLETPVGEVRMHLDEGGVAIENVVSWRERAGVAVATARHGRITGDIAWGGNWFFVIREGGGLVASERIEALTAFCWDVRRSLLAAGIRDPQGAEIDHVAVCGAPQRADADSKNFVLCPGGAYDRSPCGTGTSAILACLAADDRLQEGQRWRQESIIGSLFGGTFRWAQRSSGRIVPTIRGRAFLTADTRILLDRNDPYCWGIGSRVPD